MALRPCTIEECSSPVASRGMCQKHYARWRAHGDPNVLLTNYGVSAIDRLMARVTVEGECWLVTSGHIDDDGYAIIKVDGKSRKAHRVAYEHVFGPIPDGLDIDHTCRRRNCVQPFHLDPVTTGENQRRGLNGVLKTKCVNGHPYDSDNVRVNIEGARFCIICAREAQRRYRRNRSAVKESTT